MHRWVCPRCQSNNMLASATCFRCGAGRDAGAVTLLDQGAQAPTVMSARPRRRLSPWLLLLLVPLLPVVFCVVPVAWLVHLSHEGEGPTPTPLTTPAVFRVHRSDVLAQDTSGHILAIRCRLCGGSGVVSHFGHSGDSHDLSNYYANGQMPCPLCRGSRAEDTSREHVVIVGDLEPTSY